MSIYKFPQQNNWKQNNLFDDKDDIVSSFNIDLTSKRGKVRNTRMLTVARGVDDDTYTHVASLGLAVAFRFYNGVYYAATGSDGGSRLSRVSPFRTNPWSLDESTDAPTNISDRYSDMEIFNDRLYVSNKSTTLDRNDAGTWLNGGIAITGAASSRSKMMTVFGGKLYVTADYAKINSMSSAEAFGATIGTSTDTIDLGNPSSNTITFLRATSTSIWIGTVNRLGGKGHIYKWDGVSNNVTKSFKLQSSGAMAATVKDDVLYVMDNDGRLLSFNGGTFQEIDRLPVKQGEYLFFPLGAYNNRWIHPNAMTVQDDRILILIDNEYRGATATSEENVPSGIWEWTQGTGLYHKYAFSNHNATSGSLTDYGQNRISIAGALSSIKSESDDADDNGSLLAGVQLYTDASTIENHIQIDDLNDTIQKYGYFKTRRVMSESVEDNFQKLITRYKKLLNTGDKMWVKYMSEENAPLDISITTWAGSSAVNTDTDISAYSAGDEIEFLQGQGAGKSFHIESITDLGGGSTQIELDEEFTSVGGSGIARLQKWILAGSYDGTEVFREFDIDVSNTWVQMKVCIQFTGSDELEDMYLITREHKKLE